MEIYSWSDYNQKHTTKLIIWKAVIIITHFPEIRWWALLFLNIIVMKIR